MPYIEDEFEFDERHKRASAADCPPVQVKDRTLFENGAWRTEFMLYDPSPDPVERNRMRIQYYRAALQDTLTEFRAIKNDVSEQAALYQNCPTSCPPPEPGWEAALAKLQNIANKFKAKIAELEAKVPEDPRLAAARAQAFDIAERRAAAERTLADLRAFQDPGD